MPIIRDKSIGSFPVLKVALAITGVFLIGIVVLGSRGRPVVYDSHISVDPGALTDTVPPFPEARGPGALAWAIGGGCRDSMINHGLASKVWHVTTLNDLGTGSMKAIVEDSAAIYPSRCKYVLFDVGGTIVQASQVSVDFGGIENIYIAGQTATGAGIELKNGGVGMQLDSEHLILRHFVIRAGSPQGFTLSGADTAIVDHVSMSHTAGGGGQNAMNVAGNLNTSTFDLWDVTISHSLFGVVDVDHPTQAHCGGEPKSTPPNHNCFFLRNAFLGDATNRKPLIEGADTAWVIENISFNQNDKGVQAGSDVVVDIRQIYMKEGIRVGGFKAMPFLGANGCRINEGGDDICTMSFFVEGIRGKGNNYALNASFGSMVDDSSTTRVVACIDQNQDAWSCVDGDTIPDSLFVLTPHGNHDRAGSKAILTIQTITDARVNALLDLGTNNCAGDCRALLPDGSWSDTSASGVRRRMWYDSAIVQQFKDSTGGPLRTVSGTAIADGPTAHIAVGGVVQTPTRASGGSPPPDTDGDDLPDAFELRWFGSITSSAVWDDDGDGDWYTNGDEYLNGTNPNISEFTTPSGPVSTFGNNRWVYQDILVEYLLITAGGTDTQTVLIPDTSVYSPTALSAFVIIPKDIAGAAGGDTVIILTNDSIVGNVAMQFDTLQADSAFGVLGSEGEWARCGSRGICVDSLRNRSLP